MARQLVLLAPLVSVLIPACLVSLQIVHSVRAEIPAIPELPLDAAQLQIPNAPAIDARRLADPTLELTEEKLAGECTLIPEFAMRQTLVMAWRSDSPGVGEVQAEIVRHVREACPVVVIGASEEELHDARQSFLARDVALEGIRFLEVPIDTVWVRDFGPLSLRTRDGRPLFLDAVYCEIDADRGLDEVSPMYLARHLGVRMAMTSLQLEGGNLLTNGQGLALATTKLVADNQSRGIAMKEVRRRLRDLCQLQDVRFLEPLAGEPTAHVDMFATFINAETVVVGEYRPEDDRFNARLLNDNARQLADVVLGDRPLRVERIPMPARNDDEVWLTYCNVVFANGVLLVPFYEGHEDTFEQACAVYRRLLPAWQIRGIDCSELIGSGGALHCITLNMPQSNLLMQAAVTPARRPLVAVRRLNSPPVRID